MLLDLLVGESPASERMGAWFDRHPWAALAVFLGGIVAAGLLGAM